MTASRHPFALAKRLRTRAEKLLAKTPRDVAAMTTDDVQKMVHDLQVHQIELEIQNEELRRTQLELEAARERLLVPYDAAPVGFLSLNGAGVIQECNLAAAHLLNVDRVKLAGQNLTHFIAPEFQDEFYLCRRRLFSTGEVQKCELRMWRTGGGQFIAQLEAVIEREGADEAPSSRCLVVMSDITGQKRAEEIIRSQELQLRQITETTPIMLTRCGRDLHYQFVNRAYAEMLGLTPEQIVGKSIVEIMGAEGFEAIRPHVESVLRGQQVEYEHLVPYARVGARFLRVAYSPDTDERGEVRGWVGTISDITERKRAEAALRESEDRFSQMADAAPVLIWLSGPDKLCTYFNRPWLEFTGRTLEQELGNGWADSVHPADLQRCLKIYTESFDARQEFKMEYRLKRHDGEYRWILDHGIPRFAGNREFLGYIGSCVDLTERKQAEEALQDARVKLEQRVLERTQELKWANEALLGEKAFSDSLIELAPAVIALLDSQANLIRTNAYTQQITGYPFAESQGRNMLEMFVPEEERPRLRRLLIEVLRGQLMHAVVAPLRIRDGSIRQIEWHSKPIPNAAGELTTVLAIGQDITERQQAEEALRRSEHHLATFFNQAPIGLAWLSVGGTALRANRAQLEMLRCSAPDEFVGHSFLEFCVEPSHGREFLARLAARETVRNLRMTHRCKNGTIVHALVDANSFWVGDQFQYSSVFIRDITDRVNLEQEILHVSEREHRRIAQDLHDGLGQLLVGAAYLTGTVRQDLAAKFRPEARKLHRVWELVNEAVAQTRTLARGLHPVEPEPNGLMAALDHLATRTKNLFQISCRFICRRPVLVHDNTIATHLFRIAQEAVTNAIKHGKPGNIGISLTETPDHLMLAVMDDGSGMSARRRKRAGMGLRIMRYRAGMIGGSLAIQKGPEGGTTIVCTVHLPDGSIRKRKSKTRAVPSFVAASRQSAAEHGKRPSKRMAAAVASDRRGQNKVAPKRKPKTARKRNK